MKIAIIGFGLEGRAAYDYYKDGNDITICDQNEACEVPAGVNARLGDGYLSGLDEFDVIVRSPFVHPRQIAEANSPAILDKVTSNTNEFLRVCPTRNIIGITGTKGKGTTSTLTTEMLRAAGKRVHLGGNIGLPALELLKNDIQPDDWVVLEISSYQLIDCKTSPRLAACLMVVPEHLDWHADQTEYFTAKQQLFRWQKPEDTVVFYAGNENTKWIVSTSAAKHIPYFEQPGAYVEDGKIIIDGQTICATEELKLIGKHNWQNVCAATTLVWQVSRDIAAIRKAATSFSGLPFRIEFRRELNGVKYYDDSFATGPGACLAAFMAIEEPKVMIVGGFDRGLELDELPLAFNEHPERLRKVLLIGASAKRTAETFDKHGFTNYVMANSTDMPGIVQEATALAQPGDAVVLSPGFASFDMFKNFEDRGRQFNAAVEQL